MIPGVASSADDLDLLLRDHQEDMQRLLRGLQDSNLCSDSQVPNVVTCLQSELAAVDQLVVSSEDVGFDGYSMSLPPGDATCQAVAILAEAHTTCVIQTCGAECSAAMSHFTFTVQVASESSNVINCALPDSCASSGLGAGAIVGIVFGSIFACIACVIGTIYALQAVKGKGANVSVISSNNIKNKPTSLEIKNKGRKTALSMDMQKTLPKRETAK